MEKSVAISILEDIQQALNDTNNAKDKALKTIELYRKNLEIATNDKLKELIKKHTEYCRKYGEDDRKTLKLSKKIDKELHKIFDN